MTIISKYCSFLQILKNLMEGSLGCWFDSELRKRQLAEDVLGFIWYS